MRLFAATLLTLAAFALPAAAQDHDHMEMPTTASQAGDAPSTIDFKAANAKMHMGMAIKYTGDADADFVRGMIPHHQGAVDMAQAELKYGKDPELKKLATDIIAAQEKEIAMMKEWLGKHGK